VLLGATPPFYKKARYSLDEGNIGTAPPTKEAGKR